MPGNWMDELQGILTAPAASGAAGRRDARHSPLSKLGGIFGIRSSVRMVGSVYRSVVFR